MMERLLEAVAVGGLAFAAFVLILIVVVIWEHLYFRKEAGAYPKRCEQCVATGMNNVGSTLHSLEVWSKPIEKVGRSQP